jgi:hypothetical protein
MGAKDEISIVVDEIGAIDVVVDSIKPLTCLIITTNQPIKHGN